MVNLEPLEGRDPGAITPHYKVLVLAGSNRDPYPLYPLHDENLGTGSQKNWAVWPLVQVIWQTDWRCVVVIQYW